MTRPRRPDPAVVAVFTGDRADHGLLRPVLAALGRDRGLAVALVVAGVPRSAELRQRLAAIRADGRAVAARVALAPAVAGGAAMARSLGGAVTATTAALTRLRPAALVVLGDRFEVLAAALSAYCLGVPVAHLHGGEVTVGALDDAFRHAVTKLAQFHFVSAEAHARRVRQLGEARSRVFDVGPLCADTLGATVRPAVLAAALGAPVGAPLILVVLHPETARPERTRPLADAMAAALARLVRDRPGASVCVFAANGDAGADVVNEVLEAVVRAHPRAMRLFVSLPNPVYVTLLRRADVIVGNSSSGVLEAPRVGTPAVNVGDRQRGRARGGPGVDDVRANPRAILRAIDAALAAGRRRVAPRAKRGGEPRGAAAVARILGRELRRGPPPPKVFHDAIETLPRRR